MISAIPSFSQEKPGFSNEENERIQDELNSHNDASVILNKEKENPRDSLFVKPVSPSRPKSESQPSKKTEEEEETLSFNVLYYIIQKFKVSDMIN